MFLALFSTIDSTHPTYIETFCVLSDVSNGGVVVAMLGWITSHYPEMDAGRE